MAAVKTATTTNHSFGKDIGSNDAQDTEASPGDADGNEDPGPCSCCGKSIDEGQVILFNSKCWHPACFHCITCDSLLDINMNVYLDGEGNPICGNCMHNCSICNLPITDFAMMYGKEMYHEECFRCQECHATISGTVYANTSKGVYCVTCHNERMTRSRKHHEERKRRAKERSERRAREREKSSPGNTVDRDKSLPAPPPEPSPNLSSHTLSPIPLSEAAFQTHLMVGRVNGMAEDDLRSKRFSRNMAAMAETELRLNTVASPRAPSTPHESKQASTDTPDDEDDGAFIPVVLDKSSLPNSPDPSQPQHFESPVVEFNMQSPAIPNPQIQKLINEEPVVKSPPRQDTLPSPGLERKMSLTSKAKEATEAIGRKMSLRSRRKNSKTNASDSTDWKLEDIPRRKNSAGLVEPPDTASSQPKIKSAVPDFPAPPSNHPRIEEEVKAVSTKTGTVNPTSDRSASPPISPNHFTMRNDSVSEVSTVMTPTSAIFDGKGSVTNGPIASTSPPVPVRHPNHSPKPSLTAPPTPLVIEPQHNRKSSLSKTSPTHDSHTSDVSASRVSIHSSSRPSTSKSEVPPTPSYSSPIFDISPVLPSLPSPGVLSFEDEMTQMWLKHDRKGSKGSQGSHKRGPSTSSQTGVFSKVSNSLRHARSSSADQGGMHSRQTSKGHLRQPSNGINSVAEVDEEKAALRRQLRKSANQIVELEMKLQEDGEEKVEVVESKLEGSKDALAFVETERELALREVKVLLKHHYALDNSSTRNGLQEDCDAILNDFENSLEKLKDQMRNQIKEYTAVRTQLLEETGHLRSLRDNYLEEAQQLNKKNDELSDLNNDIQRNMDRTPTHTKTASDARSGFSLFKTHKNSPTNQSVSSLHSAIMKSGDPLSHPMYFDSRADTTVMDSPMSRLSDMTVIADEPLRQAVVTRVTDQDNAGLPPPPKKFNWKKNTATLKKNAVKGFKSVWSGETTILVSPPQTTISPPHLVSSTSQGNGLNILLPQAQGTAASMLEMPSEMYKTHSFHPKAFKRWQKCGYCGEKLSGTEMRCIGCDYQCHAKCLMSVTMMCTGTRKPLRDADSSSIASSEPTSLFGSDLGRQTDIEGRPVPYIITRCIEEVEKNGMDYEGIYRKSGGASSLRAIIDAFEAGGEVNFEHLSGSGDICAVTSALKQYLRTLPDPLIPFGMYDRFIQAAIGTDDNLKMAKFRGVFDHMPRTNYDCLSYLMLHLDRVVKKSDVNLMHANNLAVVFSPTVMRDVTGARQITDMQATNMCVKFLIENAVALFESKRSVSMERHGTQDSVTSISRNIDNRI